MNVPLPVVPEDRDARRAGDDEVGVAVAVQVCGRAAGAFDPDAGARLARDVDELPVHVLEERALRGAALRVPGGQVDVGVGVDDEEVEPAVVVVVQPADAAAHHRLGVVGHRVAERVLVEVDAELRRDVHEAKVPEASDPLRLICVLGLRAGQLKHDFRAALTDDHEAAAGECEVPDVRERGRRAALRLRLPWGVHLRGDVAGQCGHHAIGGASIDRLQQLQISRRHHHGQLGTTIGFPFAFAIWDLIPAR